MLAYISADFWTAGELIPLLRLWGLHDRSEKILFKSSVVESAKKVLAKIIRRKENSYPSKIFASQCQTHVGQSLLLCIRYIIRSTMLPSMHLVSRLNRNHFWLILCSIIPSCSCKIWLVVETKRYIVPHTHTQKLVPKDWTSEKGPPARLYLSSSRAESTCERNERRTFCGPSSHYYLGVSPGGFPSFVNFFMGLLGFNRSFLWVLWDWFKGMSAFQADAKPGPVKGLVNISAVELWQHILHLH